MTRAFFFNCYLVCLATLLSCEQTTPIQSKAEFISSLQELMPEATIESTKAPSDEFKYSVKIGLPQPLDHRGDSGEFVQYIYLSHRGFDLPTVLETEGYWAGNNLLELSSRLNANQLVVEYRYYGESSPDKMEWQYLNNDAAVEDYHRIVTILKKLYKGKWVSTGTSKGGETSLIYRSKYPKDMDATVAYVAPVILDTADVRPDQFLKTVGDEACRNSLIDFQREVLKRQSEILPLLKAYAVDKGYAFGIGIEKALEYSVLEYTFSFWQWGSSCKDVPGVNASARELFDHLMAVSGVYLYSDSGIKRYEPSFYQHFKELGYYGFDASNVKDLLQHVSDTSNRIFAPKNVDLSYDRDYMPLVLDWLVTKGDQIIYVYGGFDTWASCAVNPGPEVDALKVVLPGGSHGTRIGDFPEQDQEKIYAKLETWLEK